MKKELLRALDAALQDHTTAPDVLKPTGWPRARSTQDTGTSFHKVPLMNVVRVIVDCLWMIPIWKIVAPGFLRPLLSGCRSRLITSVTLGLVTVFDFLA